jgi:mono/diheme cytochrome c family protein
MAVYQPAPDSADSSKLALAKENVAGTAHDIPAPSDCVSCHGDDETRRPLGLTAFQLPWSETEGLSLERLIAEGRIAPAPDGPFEIPGDALTQAALGYFDTNCGSCHREGSTFVDEKIPLRMELTTATVADVESSNVHRTAIGRGPHVLGMGTTLYIVPGEPEESFVWRRMSVRDDGGWQMPPLATEVLDAQGVALIEGWIRNLEPQGN